MMEFSPEDVELVENNLWYAHYDKSVAGYYVLTHDTEGKTKSFLQLMYPDMSKETESGDHIKPMEKLNNTRENTRVVNATIQNTNRPLQENNISGIKGVCYHKSRGCWIAKWATHGHREYQTASYAVAKYGYDVARQMAIDARNRGVNQSEQYKIAGVTDIYEQPQEPTRQPKVRPVDCLPGVRYEEKDNAWMGEFVNNEGKREKRYFAGKRDDQNARNQAITFRQEGVASSDRYTKS